MPQISAPGAAQPRSETPAAAVPSSSPVEALEALLATTAFHPINDRGWIRVTGQDRVRWLNGMVTNSIGTLSLGESNYNFILNAQGQIQGDATIFAGSNDLLIETGLTEVATLLPLLDRFIIMDDVELRDASPTRRGLLLAGPKAAPLLAQLDLDATHLPELSLTHRTWRNANLDLIHAHSPIVPRFELWADPAVIDQLEHALNAQSVTRAGNDALEWLRTLEGTPRFGTDIRGRELPQETAPPGTPSRALHFNKGCYLGQEIVERIRSRGKVNRTFSGFLLEGRTPPPGTALFADGKPVGELTTVSEIPPSRPFPGGARLGLGYIRREALEQHAAPHRPITFDGGAVLPSALPFPLPGSHT